MLLQPSTRPQVGAQLAVLAAGIALGATAQEWQGTRCVLAALPPQALFEVSRSVDDFEAADLSWQPLRGDQNARTATQLGRAQKHSGEAALRVDYTFLGGRPLEYVQVTRPLEIPEPGLGLGFWVRTDGTPFPLRVRFTDTSGETHQLDLIDEPAPGWRFVAVALDGPGTAWGGDGNNRRDYPLKLAGICIDRTGVEYAGQGSLWIDDVGLVAKRQVPDTLRVATLGLRFGHVYEPGESVALRFTGQGQRVRWTATDDRGTACGQGEGPATGTEARFAMPVPGHYTCRVELLGDGGVLETQDFQAAAVPADTAARMSDFVGLNCHFGQNAYPLECMDLMRRYGIGRIRDEMGWVYVEKDKGQYALPDHLRKYLAHAAVLRMRPLVILDYHSPHYDQGGFPNSPEAVAGFANYAVNLVRLTQGTVNEVEVWNEWIGGCGMNGKPGDHGPEAYGRLLAATWSAVKAAHPGVTVVGVGGEYGKDCAQNVTRMIAAAGTASMDAFSIHPYRYPRAPEESALTAEVSGTVAAARAGGATAPAWITEIGYPTHRGQGGSTPAAQARHAVRTLLLLQATEGVQRVYWYDLKDDGLSREYNEHAFGLVHHQEYNCAPKPAMVAVSTFARLTAQAQVTGVRQLGEAYAVTYRQADGDVLIAAWTTSSEGTSLRLTGKPAAAWDMMGRRLPAGVTMPLALEPIYMQGNGIRLAE